MDGKAKLAQLFKRAREEKNETVPELVRGPTTAGKRTRTEETFEERQEVVDRKRTKPKEESLSFKVSSDSKKIQRKKAEMRLAHEKDPRNPRTVFIGNLPSNTKRKDVLKLVSPYGSVESLRQRSVAIAPGKLPVNIARKLGKQQTGASVNYYVVMATEECASACLELNGMEINGRHVRVDLATPTKDTQHTVFVGNLPFDTDEEELRETFQKCGEVDSVRIVKDNRTGIGKGFGYVKFRDTSGVLFGCKQNGRIELKERKLRVFRCYNKLKHQTKFGAMKAQPGERWVQPVRRKKRNDVEKKKKKVVDKAKRDKRKREKHGGRKATKHFNKK